MQFLIVAHQSRFLIGNQIYRSYLCSNISGERTSSHYVVEGKVESMYRLCLMNPSRNTQSSGVRHAIKFIRRVSSLSQWFSNSLFICQSEKRVPRRELLLITNFTVILPSILTLFRLASLLKFKIKFYACNEFTNLKRYNQNI